MNIVTFISGYDGCGYYRAVVPSLALNKFPNIKATIQTQYSKPIINWADIIVLQKQYKEDAWPWLQYAKKQNKVILYEADDDYFNIPEWNPTAKWFDQHQDKWLRFIKESDALIVSTDHLKKQYLQYNPKIFVLENGINFDIIKKLEQQNPIKKVYKVGSNYQKTEILKEEIIQSKKDGFIHIGWGGSPTHRKDLSLIEDLFLEILSKYSSTKIFHIGYTLDYLARKAPPNRFYMIEGVDVEYYLPLLDFCQLDIGVAPLVDNIFNRSKSNLKIIEYMSLKTAAVASSVENYKKTLEGTEAGFLCETKKSWKKSIDKLIKNQELREKIINNGFNLARENYNSEKQATKRLSIYQQLLGEK